MNSNDKLYKYYFYGFLAILALPVITTPALLNPTAWGKVIIFRIILSILIFISIYKYKDLIIKKSKVLYLLIGFLALIILSTIFSLDPNFSFWGSPLRGDGSLNYIFYIIFAILTFLIVKKTDWEKLWKFSIFIGVLVSAITLLQYFGLFGKTIRTYDGRPPGTLGGPIFLALYLLLLVFITFSFFLKETRKRRVLYLLASLLFVYVILLTNSRAIWFGLFIGFVYFILTFPKKSKLLLIAKISFLVLIVLGAFGIYYINTSPELVDSVSSRLSIKLARDDPRFSAWILSAEAIKDYPILGYGPENFSIAFDRYYDPSLPFISKEWGSWYDRAHNFIFEMGITYGIPALLVYLALIAALFWKLQKIKYGPNTFIIHGIQATFFAYLSANIFSFDIFSTYLIFFLIIGYSLSLTSKEKVAEPLFAKSSSATLNPIKSISLCLLFIFLLGFIWYGGLKPLYINKDTNMADHYARTKKCDKAVDLMQSKVIYNSSTIDSYAKLKYISIIERCNARTPEAIELLKRVAEIRPNYTRTWIFLGNYTGNTSYFDKASELSPNREEIIIGRIKSDFANQDYQEAKEKTQQCLKLNPKSKYCWWSKILSHLYLDEIDQAHADIEEGAKNDFSMFSERNFSQFKTICEKTESKECFKELSDILYSLIISPTYNFDPEYNFNLIYISIRAEKEEILKGIIKNILRKFPELESKLRDNLRPVKNINQKMVDQYINNCRKIAEILAIIKNLSISESKPINFYKSESEEIGKINEINKKIKLFN